VKPLIVANWKMNPVSLAEARKLINLEKKGTRDLKRVEVAICPPSVFLPALRANGAQDCFWEEKGAYTGEISPKMLRKLGVKYVILGHSERRKYQKETDEMINRKVKAVLVEKMKPILCIDKASQLRNVPRKDVIIAYEPLFAIGTGKACSPEKAGKMRRMLKEFMIVLYGGSVNSKNAEEYVKAGFQGLLVGGAALNSKEFIAIVKNLWKRF